MGAAVDCVPPSSSARSSASLWKTADVVAPRVAEGVYRCLAPEHAGGADAATALHRTIRELRDKRPTLPELWAAYVHIGQ
jgi:hypothetical protein